MLNFPLFVAGALLALLIQLLPTSLYHLTKLQDSRPKKPTRQWSGNNQLKPSQMKWKRVKLPDRTMITRRSLASEGEREIGKNFTSQTRAKGKLGSFCIVPSSRDHLSGEGFTIKPGLPPLPSPLAALRVSGAMELQRKCGNVNARQRGRAFEEYRMRCLTGTLICSALMDVSRPRRW